MATSLGASFHVLAMLFLGSFGTCVGTPGPVMRRATRHEEFDSSRSHAAAITANAHLSQMAQPVAGASTDAADKADGDTTSETAAADDSVAVPATTAAAADAVKLPSGYTFMMRSILTSECLRVADDGQSFQQASCDSNDKQQKFIATGFVQWQNEMKATNVTMFNGKVICYTGSDKAEAYDHSCNKKFQRIELFKDSNNGCFRMKWAQNNHECGYPPCPGTIWADKCLAPPDHDQDMVVLPNNCEKPDGLWVNPLENPDQITCPDEK